MKIYFFCNQNKMCVIKKLLRVFFSFFIEAKFLDRLNVFLFNGTFYTVTQYGKVSSHNQLKTKLNSVEKQSNMENILQ